MAEKHYLTGKEIRKIAKENKKAMMALEKEKWKKKPESEFTTVMKDENNILEIEDLNDLLGTLNTNRVDKDVVDYLKQKYNTYQANPTKKDENGNIVPISKDSSEYAAKCAEYEDWIFCAENIIG